MTIDPTSGIDVQFIDNPNAPVLFSDSASGLWLLNGILRITLETWSTDHGHPDQPYGPVSRVVTARIAMPAAAAESMAKDILSTIANLREQAARAAALHEASTALN